MWESFNLKGKLRTAKSIGEVGVAVGMVWDDTDKEEGSLAHYHWMKDDVIVAEAWAVGRGESMKWQYRIKPN